MTVWSISAMRYASLPFQWLLQHSVDGVGCGHSLFQFRVARRSWNAKVEGMKSAYECVSYHKVLWLSKYGWSGHWVACLRDPQPSVWPVSLVYLAGGQSYYLTWEEMVRLETFRCCCGECWVMLVLKERSFWVYLLYTGRIPFHLLDPMTPLSTWSVVDGDCLLYLWLSIAFDKDTEERLFFPPW